ncbi:MAG: hypothetical protein JW767_03670 [Thermoleophilia bacterium]|nr:hypothetical protein [Thermoleophilia bacterium]
MPALRSVRPARAVIVLAALAFVGLAALAAVWLSSSSVAPPVDVALAAETPQQVAQTSSTDVAGPVEAKSPEVADEPDALTAAEGDAVPVDEPASLEERLAVDPRPDQLRPSLGSVSLLDRVTDDAGPSADRPQPENLGLSPALDLSPSWVYEGLPPARQPVDIAAGGLRTVYVAYDYQSATKNIALEKIVDGEPQWMKVWDGGVNGDDYVGAVAVRGSAIYTVGDRATRYGDSDLVVIKRNPDGTKVWTRYYDSGAHGWEIATDAAVDGNGNLTVVGLSYSWTNDFDVLVVSYKPDGTRRWARRYDGPTHLEDAALSLKIDSAGRIYVCGYTGRFLSGDYVIADALTIKYSTSGERLWVRRYNGSGDWDDWAQSLRLRPGGGVYVGGIAWGGTSGAPCGMLLSYKADGTRVFALEDGGDAATSDSAWFNDIEVVPGGHVLCGGAEHLLASGWQPLLLDVAPDGTVASREVQEAPGVTSTLGSEIMVMAKDSQGGVIASGTWATETGGVQFVTQRRSEGGWWWTSAYPSEPPVANPEIPDVIPSIATSGVNVFVLGARLPSVLYTERRICLMGYVY